MIEHIVISTLTKVTIILVWKIAISKRKNDKSLILTRTRELIIPLKNKENS